MDASGVKDWDEVRAYVLESYCLIAPKRLVKLVGNAGDPAVPSKGAAMKSTARRKSTSGRKSGARRSGGAAKARSLMGILVAMLALHSGCARERSEANHSLSPANGDYRALIGGVEIAYHIAGQGPVLIAHPGGPGGEWSYLRMPSVEKTFTVVYIEPVGSGTSGKLEKRSDYTMSRYVDDVDGLRAHLGFERITLLGHSHGGFVAQSYVLAHPDRVAGLILYDTTPTSGPDWQRDVESNLNWFAAEPWFAQATAALAEETSARTDEQITSIFRREAPLYFADYTGRKAEFDPMIARMQFSIDPVLAISDTLGESATGVAPPSFDVRNRLSEIKAPTLIISGRKDFVCSVKMAEVIHAGIAGSQLTILEESGHMGHIEEPDRFAAAIVAFMRPATR
jgi:proline iminopeptidase